MKTTKSILLFMFFLTLCSCAWTTENKKTSLRSQSDNKHIVRVNFEVENLDNERAPAILKGEKITEDIRSTVSQILGKSRIFKIVDPNKQRSSNWWEQDALGRWVSPIFNAKASIYRVGINEYNGLWKMLFGQYTQATLNLQIEITDPHKGETICIEGQRGTGGNSLTIKETELSLKAGITNGTPFGIALQDAAEKIIADLERACLLGVADAYPLTLAETSR